jgi:ubiquitin-conjugating enzyme (huntingtin interacting protein 2)
MAAEIRLTKELKDVSKVDESSGVRAVQLSSNDKRHLKGTLKGPEGTAYEGGVFEVDIVIPNAYPFEPPRMVSFIARSLYFTNSR